MRVFSAGIGTETNTFAPLPTGLDDFYAAGYFKADKHPAKMSRYAAPLFKARARAQAEGWTVLQGLFANAQPSGMVTRQTYETLRDELLQDLREVMPIDIVLLGLHGAMVADGYDDCEGDLLEKVREIVGPNAVVGAELDPHAHLSERMVINSSVLVAYKEYPHTDIVERAEELVDLCARIAKGEVRPTAAVVDTRMVIPIHTSKDPGRSFVDALIALEGKNGVLSISPIQGFATGDVPSMGTKVLVYTDDNQPQAQALATRLAEELNSRRDEFRVKYLAIDEALDNALAGPRPAVLADRADNPGSGAAGDSTFILQRLLERKLTHVALGPIWDPMAVQVAFAAGEGARLSMRIGGKVSPMSGAPVDALVQVKAVRRGHVQTGQTGELISVGDAALVQVEGIECLLISSRQQAFDIDLFTGIGCDLATKDIIVVKSAQHFYASYSKLTKHIYYVGAQGSATPRYDQLPYLKAQLPKWPITPDA